jgi:hypothetical protein
VRIENSFIPVRGVGERTEQQLWRQGITHWDEFTREAVGPTTADRIEQYIAEARDRLRRGDAAYFGETFPGSEQWRLYENFRDSACFFDIETTGLDHARDDVTTVSFRCDGETTTLVRGQDLTRDALEAQFEAADLLVTFNGKRFDVPFLERSFDLSLSTPHVDLLYPCRRLGLTGGLKAVENEIGIERDRPDISGRDAVRLWHRYERGDDAALETLVGYNREDAVNLRTLMDTVADRLHRATFPDDA